MAKQETGLTKLQSTLLGKGSIEIFRDAIPGKQGEEAERAAARFAKLVYQAVSLSPDLQKCSVPSIIRAASISASLDLDIDPRGLAYLVPYKGQAQFQIGYLGLVELAYRSGKVKAINAEVIYQSEIDKVKITRENGKIHIVHPYDLTDPPTGDIIAAYACTEIEGYGVHTTPLRVDEIEFYRSKSACPNSPAWKQFYAAMCKKTVIRQNLKLVPKSLTKEVQAGIVAEDKQVTFVESKVIAQQQIDEGAGSMKPGDVFGEQTEPAPEKPSFLED